MSDQGIHVTIYYDGDCPFCSDYVLYLRLKETASGPWLVNLRDAPECRQWLEAEGLDPDTGMVADISGRRYHGAEALQALALLTTQSSLFNRVTASLFSSPTVSRYIYPILRAGRNTVLTLLGREPFRADDRGWQALFTIFSFVFGFFAVFHFFSYAFVYTPFEIYLSTWLILLFGTALLLWPGSKRAFALLIVVMAVDAWLHAPTSSNHTILRNFLLLGFLGSAVWHLFKGSRWSDFFRDVVPVGRVLILVMYFFGVFHKFNEGFLDPEVSCAVTLWREMAWPIHLLDHPIIHYLAIYGTFVVEAIIVVALLIPRFRKWGIVLGIGFHSFLALSGFANYQAFSTLAVALHVLFLSPEQAQGIVRGEHWRRLMTRIKSWQGRTLLPLCLLLVAFYSIQHNHTMVTFVWLLMAALLFMAILLPGEAVEVEHVRSTPAGFLWSRLGLLNLVGVLFFINCAMPYFGLKTAQAMNMFANLRLEGGINNHLVFKWAPAPFGYLDDLVYPLSASGERSLEHIASSGYHLVYYDLLHRLDLSPAATITFVRAGEVYQNQSSSSLAEEIAATLHPEWFRKWFHFRLVHRENPPPCL